MVERLADIVTQIQTFDSLGRSLRPCVGIAASPSAERLDRCSPASRRTLDVVSRAIGQAMSLLPMDGTRVPPLRRAKLGLILFCAEQGFVGAFSERVLDAGAGDLGSSTVPGYRDCGAAVASERGIKLDMVSTHGHPCRRDPKLRQPAG